MVQMKRKRGEKAAFEEPHYKAIKEAATKRQKVRLLSIFAQEWLEDARRRQVSPGGISTAGSKMDKRIIEENPCLGKNESGNPNLPWKGITPTAVREDIINEANAKSSAKTLTKLENPVEIRTFFAFQDCFIEMIKHGLKHKQIPMVQFGMGWCFPLRPNDLVMVERANGDMPSKQTYFFVDDFLKPEEGRRVPVGTLVNLLPSKQTDGKNVVPGYCCPALVKPEYYPLLKEALNFLLSEENYEVEPTRDIKDILTDPKPCGCSIIKQDKQNDQNLWSKHWQEICDHFNVGAQVANWGWREEKKFFTPQHSRNFGASVLFYHVFESENGTADYTAISKCLGHAHPSMQTNYQKFKILGDPKIRGVKLGKLEQPIQGLTEGVAMYIDETPVAEDSAPNEIATQFPYPRGHF